MYIGLPVKYPLFVVDFNFINIFSKNTKISNFIEIRPVGAELFMSTERETGRHDEPNSRFSQFCERA